MTPVPDPNGGARNVESRLEAIERHLNLRSPTRPRTYDDPFKSRNPGSGTGTGGAVDRVQPDDTNFGAPKRGGTGVDDPNAPFEENTKKPVLPAPVPGSGNEGTSVGGAGASESVIQTKKPAAGTVDENSNKKSDQGLRLDTRITSRAVSPRERQTITISGANAAVATAKKPTTPKADARTVNVAKY